MIYIKCANVEASAKNIVSARKLGIQMIQAHQPQNYAVFFYKSLKDARSKTARPIGTLYYMTAYAGYIYGTGKAIYACKKDGQLGKKVWRF